MPADSRPENYSYILTLRPGDLLYWTPAGVWSCLLQKPILSGYYRWALLLQITMPAIILFITSTPAISQIPQPGSFPIRKVCSGRRTAASRHYRHGARPEVFSPGITRREPA